MEKNFFTFSNISQFDEITHGISTRLYGDMRFGTKPNQEVVKNRQGFFEELGINIENVTVPALAHGTKIAHITQKERGMGGKNPKSAILETDGLITSEKGIFLMVTAADCLPIMFYNPVIKLTGVIHAGWRGIIGKIVPRAIERMESYGSRSEDLFVGIGPGICQRHFIVRSDILPMFSAAYPKATFLRNNDGYIDLKRAAVLDLEKAGVLSRNIEVSEYCPYCNNSLFGSYRKEGEGVPAVAAVIGIKE
jgi:hypothetical protein